MSAAIMQTGALQFVIQNKFYDWQESSNDVADLQLKDQFNYGTIAHQQQQQQPHNGNNRMTQTMRNSVSSMNVFNSLSNSELLQNQLNAVAVMQQQQQQQQKVLHNALTRTTSHQPTNSELQLLQQLQSDTIAATECHRKLERTQSEPAPQSINGSAQLNSSSRYKTELCRPFKETGECKYGEKCQFAHGENELRTVQRHPKYKTEYCRTFYGVGLCPYGSRCHFLHDLSGEDDGNVRMRGNGRENGGQQQQQQQRFNANKEQQQQQTFGARNITSAEVDAITKAAISIPCSRPFGRSASLLNGTTSATTNPLPMSPPLSMSTGSDRASPICSLSPTNSISNFPFTESNPFNLNAVNTMANGIYSSSLHITPPASPQYSPPATPNLLVGNVTKTVNMTALTNAEKARLPIFNQISCASTIDTLKNLPL